MCELKEKFPELTNGEFLVMTYVFGEGYLGHVFMAEQIGVDLIAYSRVLYFLDMYFENDSNFWLCLEALRRKGILDSSNT